MSKAEDGILSSASSLDKPNSIIPKEAEMPAENVNNEGVQSVTDGIEDFEDSETTPSGQDAKERMGIEPLFVSTILAHGQRNSKVEADADMSKYDVKVKIESGQSIPDGKEVFERSTESEDNDTEQREGEHDIDEFDKPRNSENSDKPSDHKRGRSKGQGMGVGRPKTLEREIVPSLFKKICDNPSKWQCNSCSYTTNNMTNAKRHFQGIHSDDANFPCQFCDRRFRAQDNQRKHERRWHSHEEGFVERLSKKQIAMYKRNIVKNQRSGERGMYKRSGKRGT